MADQTPALPWAHTQHEENEGTNCTEVDEIVYQPVSIDQLQLKIGDRIEWWGACILEPEQQEQLQQQPGAPGQAATDAAFVSKTYRLRYDALGEFEEEVLPVHFITQHVLIDLNTQVDMHFRKAGEAYEPEEQYSDDPIGEVLDAADPAQGPQDTDVVTFEQLASSITDEMVAAGDSEIMQRMNSLDAVGQRYFAAGCRNLVDTLKAFVNAKASSADDGGGQAVTITVEDVEDFKAMLETQRRQARQNF
eukprot:gene9211-9378_t